MWQLCVCGRERERVRERERERERERKKEKERKRERKRKKEKEEKNERSCVQLKNFMTIMTIISRSLLNHMNKVFIGMNKGPL